MFGQRGGRRGDSSRMTDNSSNFIIVGQNGDRPSAGRAASALIFATSTSGIQSITDFVNITVQIIYRYHRFIMVTHRTDCKRSHSFISRSFTEEKASAAPPLVFPPPPVERKGVQTARAGYRERLELESNQRLLRHIQESLPLDYQVRSTCATWLSPAPLVLFQRHSLKSQLNVARFRRITRDGAIGSFYGL